jgi:hypothetical protein
MAHRKRAKCCRSSPRCDDCPLLASKSSKADNRPNDKGRKASKPHG